MLSFMREQGIETTKQSTEPAARTGEMPGTLPPTTSDQYLAVAHKKQTRKSTSLLVILFCIGGLVLLMMIKKSTPQTAAASVTADNKIETLLAQFAGVRSEMFSNVGEILDKFYKFSDVKQVKNDELIKNPFKIEAVLGGSLLSAPSVKTSASSVNVETTAQIQERYAGHMQLLSIMATDARKCCMIDDRLLYEGDSIKDLKVIQIGNNFVKLEAQSTPTDPNNKDNVRITITLKLSE